MIKFCTFIRWWVREQKNLQNERCLQAQGLLVQLPIPLLVLFVGTTNKTEFNDLQMV